MPDIVGLILKLALILLVVSGLLYCLGHQKVKEVEHDKEKHEENK